MDSEFSADLQGIECVFLDLDGTIYHGCELISGAVDFLTRLEQRGIRRFFLSNNSSRSTDQYVEKLQNLGIPVESDEILLSTHDLIAWLSAKGITQTYLVGTEGMRSMLESAGVGTSSDSPQYVVLGYDTEITYDKLEIACVHLHAGVPLVASHPDIVCPDPRGGLPDAGAFLALFAAATGASPEHVCGKPNAGMIMHKIEELGLQPSQCVMFGDRLYTDVEMANRAGVHAVLVLSGEATRDDLDNCPQKPDLVVESVVEILPGD